MLDFVHLHRDPGEEMVTMDRHLYLSEDKTRLVAEGDPAAGWLWCSPGQRVPRKEALRLGAIQPDPEPETGVTPQVKQMAAPANKQRAPGTDKGA